MPVSATSASKKIVEASVDGTRQIKQQVRALGDRQLAPGAAQRRSSRTYRAVDVFPPGLVDTCDDFARYGRKLIEHTPRARSDVGAVNEQTVLGHGQSFQHCTLHRALPGLFGTYTTSKKAFCQLRNVLLAVKTILRHQTVDVLRRAG